MNTRRALLVATVALVLLGARPADAQLGLGCTIEASPVAFGAYSAFTPAPLDSTGTITVRCTLGVGLTIALGPGSAGSFSPRRLQGGAATLAYNLYGDAGHTSVWGDGTAGTATTFQLLQALIPVVTTVHARLPAGQDVPAGSYSDTVLASFAF